MRLHLGAAMPLCPTPDEVVALAGAMLPILARHREQCDLDVVSTLRALNRALGALEDQPHDAESEVIKAAHKLRSEILEYLSKHPTKATVTAWE